MPMIGWSQTYGRQPCVAKTRECCSALSLRRTGDDLHVGLHKGFKIRLPGIVPVFFRVHWLYPLFSFPDHNSVHAADVLHGVYYFTSQKIAGFCPTDSRDCMSDSDSVSGDQSDEVTECVDHYDRLTSCIPDLERFALYSAAAMHDYDHPGRTNAFLVATLAPQVKLALRLHTAINRADFVSWCMLCT